MATLYKQHDVWWVNYSIGGKRFRISTGTKDRKLAKLKLDDLKLKVFKGEIGARPSAGKRISIPEFFRRYIDYINNSSPVDKHADLGRIRIMQEFFARKSVRYINSITPALIDEFTSTVLAGKKPKTVKNYVTLLKTALNRAVKWHLIDQNPIANVKPPKVVKTFHFFTKDEIDKLVTKAEQPLQSAIIILVNTGMRRGELFHLRWRDVDLKNENLRVWPYEGYSPKGKRPRNIPISKSLKKVLTKLSRGTKPDSFVFRPYSHDHTLYKQFVKLTESLGIKGTLHDLRHTFASHLAMAGSPIPAIKDLLGHSDIATTMIYAHLSPDIHRAEIKKLPF